MSIMRRGVAPYRSYGLGEYQVGQWAQVLSAGASIFSKLFGGAKKTYPSRSQRASSTLAAMNACMSNFPPDLENQVGPFLTNLLATQQYQFPLCYNLQVMPKSCLQTFMNQNPASYVKARAIAGFKCYQTMAGQAMTKALSDQDWIAVYNTVGFQPILDAAKICAAGCSPIGFTECPNPAGSGSITGGSSILPAYSGTMYDALMTLPAVQQKLAGLPTGTTVTTPTSTVPAAVLPMPSGQTSVVLPTGSGLPPGFMTPTTDGQAALQPITQASIAGSSTGLLLAAGLLIPLFLMGGKRERKRRARPRYKPGTTVTTRY